MTNIKKIYRVHFQLIDSTNAWAKNSAAFLEENGLSCITAEQQTRGRGRFSKRWISPLGNLYFSLFWSCSEQFPYSPYTAHQVFATTCAHALAEFNIPVKLKWPNDLFLEGKKLGGILTEAFQYKNRTGLVIGLGLNINMSQELLDKIDQPATSLSAYSGSHWDKENLLTIFIQKFRENLSLLEKKGFALFEDAYTSLLIQKPSAHQLENIMT